jgi:ATP-dependent protease ClpP protease subunit
VRKFLLLLIIAIIGFMCASRSFSKTITLNSVNTLSIRGSIDSDMFASVVDQMARNKETIQYIFINSPGGEIESGFEILDYLKASGKKTVCIASYAASMAFSLFQACDVRLITPHATLMQHIGAYSIRGKAKNNDSEKRYITVQLNELDRLDAKRMGLTVKEFNRRISFDMWLFGKEAIQNRAADHIVNVNCSPELVSGMEVITKTTDEFIISEKYSTCPIISEPISIAKQPNPESQSKKKRKNSR